MPRVYKFTKEEEAAIKVRANPACPGITRLKGGIELHCGSRSVCYVGGKGNEHFYACHRCGHEWDWTNPQGRRLTHKEYDALIKRRKQEYLADSGKTTWLEPKYSEEGDGTMAKKSATKTSKKKKGSKGSKKSKTVGAKKGKSLAEQHELLTNMTPLDRSHSSPRARACFLVHTTTKSNEEIAKIVLKEFPDARGNYKAPAYMRTLRGRVHAAHPSLSWLKGVKHAGDSYLGHGPGRTAASPKKAKKTKKATGKKRKTVSA